MPRYHFDLRDGEAFVVDEEGMELPDIESAQMEAAEFLSDSVKVLTDRRSDPLGDTRWASRSGTQRGLYFNLASCLLRASGIDTVA